jgi:hypothetical protein
VPVPATQDFCTKGAGSRPKKAFVQFAAIA